MTMRLKPEKIKGVKINGKIIEFSKQAFKFQVDTKNEDLRESLPRVRKIEVGRESTYIEPYFDNCPVLLIYLNKESLRGLYSDPKMNLPYEVLNMNFSLIYRQSIQETKEEIYNRLERAAVEEGLRESYSLL